MDWGKRLDLGEGIRYSSSGFELLEEEASWLTIGTVVHEALSPSYDESIEIEIQTVFGVEGASTDGHDAVVRGHVYLDHFPRWRHVFREGKVPESKETPPRESTG